jgi:hypothetical protein
MTSTLSADTVPSLTSTAHLMPDVHRPIQKERA